MSTNQQIKRAIQATAIADRLLSRGYKQRGGVTQAILGRPKLLILDELTNGLDPTQTEQMRQLIRDLVQDATVILSTHIMQKIDAPDSKAVTLQVSFRPQRRPAIPFYAKR